MTKAVLLPVGIGLAHTGRLIMIARQLQKRGIEVVFGVGGDAISLCQKEGLQYRQIPEFDKKLYETKIKHNNPRIYSRKIFEQFVKEELALYEKEKPDIIVYDFRITAHVSAKLAGISSVSVINADCTPYYDFSKVRFPIQTLMKKLPGGLINILNSDYGQKYIRRIGPLILTGVILSEIIRLSPALFKLGFIPKRDPYQLFGGDLTLLCDIPEFRPVKKLPQNVKMVGPIFWMGVKRLPTWSKLIKKKFIYVTAGGTGDRGVFCKILKYLKYTDEIIVATTGNTLSPKEVNISYPNLYVADYLPGGWIGNKAKLIIFPGGNATTYQALRYGIPAIATPFHIDHEDNANQMERLGTGMILSPYKNFNQKSLLGAVNTILTGNKYRQKAEKFKEIMGNYDGKRIAADEIIKFIYPNRHEAFLLLPKVS